MCLRFYVVWDLSYVVCLLCDVLSSLCQFLTALPVLGTGQIAFKRRPSSCSSALSKISRQPFRLACEGRKLHREYSEGPQTEPENVCQLSDDSLYVLV